MSKQRPLILRHPARAVEDLLSGPILSHPRYAGAYGTLARESQDERACRMLMNKNTASWAIKQCTLFSSKRWVLRSSYSLLPKMTIDSTAWVIYCRSHLLTVAYWSSNRSKAIRSSRSCRGFLMSRRFWVAKCCMALKVSTRPPSSLEYLPRVINSDKRSSITSTYLNP